MSFEVVLFHQFNLLFNSLDLTIQPAVPGHIPTADTGRKRKNDLYSRLFLIPCVMWTSCWASLSHRQAGSMGKDQFFKKNPPAATIAQLLLLARITELPWASISFS